MLRVNAIARQRNSSSHAVINEPTLSSVCAPKPFRRVLLDALVVGTGALPMLKPARMRERLGAAPTCYRPSIRNDLQRLQHCEQASNAEAFCVLKVNGERNALAPVDRLGAVALVVMATVLATSVLGLNFVNSR